MKFVFRITLATVLLLAVSSAQIPQLSPFSADLRITSTGDNTGPHEITGRVYVGNGHIRMNMEGAGHKTALLTDFATKTTDILLIEQQMYIEHKIGQKPGWADRTTQDLMPYDPDHPCADRPDVTCKKISVEEVSGRTCDHWEVTDKQDRVTNLWIDQKLHFPVKATTKDSTMLLTNIKEDQPDPALFEIPSGFHKLDMGNIMPPSGGDPPHQ